MSLNTLRTMSSAVRLKRDRRGLTLLETLVVLIVGSLLVYGLMLLIVQTQEQMWIAKQVRDISEWGNNYVFNFTRVVRNSLKTNLQRLTPPSILLAEYEDPSIEPLEAKEYVFQYDNTRDCPTVRANGVLQEYALMDPYDIQRRDARDRVEVYRTGAEKGFIIYRPGYDRRDMPNKFQNPQDLSDDPNNHDATEVYLTVDFWVRYTRTTGGRNSTGFYTKDLHFNGSAYCLNPFWPTEGSGTFTTPDPDETP